MRLGRRHVFGCVIFSAVRKENGMKKWLIPAIRAAPKYVTLAGGSIDKTAESVNS